jgi:hypothetical protein
MSSQSSPPEDEPGVGVWIADLSSFGADMVVAGLCKGPWGRRGEFLKKFFFTPIMFVATLPVHYAVRRPHHNLLL